MERKTKISAESGRQDLVVTREFELPVALLFKAYEDPSIVEQWMGTRVIKLENRRHGAWQFETSDHKGNVVVRMNGVYHDFIPGRKIIRTFEMENMPFETQLEFLEFERTTDDTSKLTMHIVYRTAALRDQMLQMPFAHGINGAHNRLEEIVARIK